MLIPLLVHGAHAPPPPPPPAIVHAIAHPTLPWTVWKVGSHWVAETGSGTVKVLNPQQIIRAAHAAGAKIRWLD